MFPLVFAELMKYVTTFFTKTTVLSEVCLDVQTNLPFLYEFISSRPRAVNPAGALKTLTATNRGPGFD